MGLHCETYAQCSPLSVNTSPTPGHSPSSLASSLMKAPVKTVTGRLYSASWHQPIPCEAMKKSVNSQEEPAASIIRAALRAEGKAFQACLKGIVKKKQERRADFPTAFIIHPCTLIRVFRVPSEISVCSLWMHIRNLCTAVCRLRMAVQRLQTETSANCLNTCSTLHRQSQHAAWAITARCEWNCTALRETPLPYGAEKQV